ncbi:unnamed protein product [Moneuplotes crassus]|uniref:Uncharacterized protein n=1 Tax=Euplotes crassus TaxID=5936 RepID=A0AAD2D645_EUPCR|nr:unnamed protein product [Moneuplotes crassus]
MSIRWRVLKLILISVNKCIAQMEMEMKFNNPAAKKQLKRYVDQYKLQFSEIKNKIYQQQESFMEEIDTKNSFTSREDHEEYNPEAQNLLNIHGEMANQENDLVRARTLGHESLKVGSQLKSTLQKQTGRLEHNLYKNDKIRRELKLSDRMMRYMKCASVCDRIMLSLIILMLGVVNAVLLYSKVMGK